MVLGLKKKTEWIYSVLPLLLFSVFSFTRGSIGIAIPATMWFAVMFLIMLISAFSIFKTRYLRGNYFLALAVYILAMVFLNRNQDFSNGVFAEALYYATALLLCVALSRRADWHKSFLKILIAVGLFYAFWTIVTVLNESIYHDFILPWIRIYEPTASRGNYMNGFTTHYSINGMYLALGTMACLSYINTGSRIGKRKKNNWIVLILVGAALLFSGKRGIVISVVLAYCITYLASARERGRMFKLIMIFAVALLAVYIASFWFEPILSVVNRFVSQLQAGDVSTGRFDIWGEAWSAFCKAPLFGNGWGWFRYNNQFGTEFHVHNCYLQWLCELGIVFTIPLLLLIGVCYYRSFKLLRETVVKMRVIEAKQNPVIKTMIYFSFLYQSYFLIFIFEGTGFYEVQTYFVYFLTIVVVEYYMKRLRERLRLVR